MQSSISKILAMAGVVFLSASLLTSQTAPPSQTPPKPAEDYSGMYSFLQDGEFVQVTVEDQGRVTGFVSRYGDLESDRGAFLDQFFKQGKLDSNKLTFTTETVQDRKSTRLNSSHVEISYAVFCLKKKTR